MLRGLLNLLVMCLLAFSSVRAVEFTEMSLNADRASKLLPGFPTTCKDRPRTLESHPLRLSGKVHLSHPTWIPRCRRRTGMRHGTNLLRMSPP